MRLVVVLGAMAELCSGSVLVWALVLGVVLEWDWDVSVLVLALDKGDNSRSCKHNMKSVLSLIMQMFGILPEYGSCQTDFTTQQQLIGSGTGHGTIHMGSDT